MCLEANDAGTARICPAYGGSGLTLIYISCRAPIKRLCSRITRLPAVGLWWVDLVGYPTSKNSHDLLRCSSSPCSSICSFPTPPSLSFNPFSPQPSYLLTLLPIPSIRGVISSSTSTCRHLHPRSRGRSPKGEQQTPPSACTLTRCPRGGESEKALEEGESERGEG